MENHSGPTRPANAHADVISDHVSESPPRESSPDFASDHGRESPYRRNGNAESPRAPLDVDRNNLPGRSRSREIPRTTHHGDQGFNRQRAAQPRHDSHDDGDIWIRSRYRQGSDGDIGGYREDEDFDIRIPHPRRDGSYDRRYYDHDDGIRVSPGEGEDFNGAGRDYDDDYPSDSFARARHNTSSDSFNRYDDYDEGIRVRSDNEDYSYEDRRGIHNNYEHHSRRRIPTWSPSRARQFVPRRMPTTSPPPRYRAVTDDSMSISQDSSARNDSTSYSFIEDKDQDMYHITFDEVEKSGLSFSMPLNKGILAVPAAALGNASPLAPEASAWKLSRMNLSDSQSSTELFVVHASEYSADEMGVGKTTLVCPAGPQKQDTETAVQMRWLHVQQPALKFKTLEQLVLNCPYITEALRPIAIEAMEKVEDKFSGISECGAFLQPGSILRFIGKYNDSSSDDPNSNETEPVIFLSSPFLTLEMNSNRGVSRDEHQPRTLLQSLYGYDVGSERESEQVAQKLGVTKSKKEMLHINQLWCLLIGSSVLITISDKSAAEIQGSTITTDSRTSGNREPLLIRLTDKKDRQYRVVVERDYNYADFLKYAVALVADPDADPSDYDLFDQSQQILKPSKWLQILGSSDSQLHTFSIRQRNDGSERKRKPGARFIHSPDPVRHNHHPDDMYLANSRNRSYEPGIRNYGVAAQDNYDICYHSGNPQGLEHVGPRRDSNAEPEGLSRGEGDPNLKSSRRRPSPLLQYMEGTAKYMERKEAEQDRNTNMQRPSRNDLTDTDILIGGDKDVPYDTGTNDWIRHSPKSLWAIEEESTQSSSSMSDRLDRDGSLDAQDPSDILQPKGSEAILDSNAKAPGIPAADPTATITITGSWAEYARAAKRHEGGPSKYNPPDIPFRYVEPGTHQLDVSNDTDLRREEYSREDEDVLQQQVPSEKKAARRPEEAEPTQRPRTIRGARIDDTKADKNTTSYRSYFDSPVRGEPSSAVSSRWPETQQSRSSQARHTYLPRSSKPASSSETYLYKAQQPSFAQIGRFHVPRSTPNLRIGPLKDTPHDVYVPRSQPSNSIIHSGLPGRATYAASLYSVDNMPETSEAAGRGAAGQIINDPSAAKKRQPQVYDLGVEEEAEEVSDTEKSWGSGSDTDSESLNRNAQRPVKRGVSIQMSTTASDPLRPVTTVTFRVYNNDSAFRFVFRRHPQPDHRTLPEITHTYGNVDDGDEDDPLDTLGQRCFYRPEPRPTGDEEVSWLDEYVIDTAPWPRPRQEWAVIIEWPVPPGHKEEMEIEHIPFLNWRLKNDEGERTPEEVEKSLVTLLSRVNKTLSKGVVARLYSRIFKCTMGDLIRRHDFLLATPHGDEVGEANKTISTDDAGRRNSESISASAPPEGLENGSPGDNSVTPTPAARSPGGPRTSGSSRTGFKQSEPTQPQPTGTSGTASVTDTEGQRQEQRQSVQAMDHDQELMKRLFDVSKEIFNAYVPDQGSPLIHHVCVRFWGAVDDIFRQVLWDSTVWRFPEGHIYTIRDFDATSAVIGKAKSFSSSKREPWSKCSSCKENKPYQSATEALEHLHKHHFDCSGKSEKPYDDPCYVWLRHVRSSAHAHQQVTGIGNSGEVEDFVSRLLPISRSTRELHSLVASTQANPSNARPLLPANVVHAFEQIIAMYVIRAQWLSLNNRRDSSFDQVALQRKIEELIEREDYAKQEVYNHLQDAKKDIILLKGTSRGINSVGVEAVGSEFLVMAIMVNLQNRSVLARSTSTAPERADFIEMYQQYTSQLRFQAHRRPKKRVFLDIHGLEEELDALQRLLEAQRSLLDKYLRLIAPGSTRTTNATRVGLYKIERKYGKSQQRILESKHENIQILRGKSEVLKEQVKKTIEILEEDHGKAIRVFTFVTLLFLPLSFVTSFMGMNTKDVRDMEFTQNIFWMTGLPVTLAVITAALIYAYRGEEVEDWVWRQMERRRRRPGRRAGGDSTRTGTVEREHKTGMIHVDSALAQTSRRDGQDGKGDARWAMQHYTRRGRRRRR